MNAVLNERPEVKCTLCRWTEDRERAGVLCSTLLSDDDLVKELMGCSCMILFTRTQSVQFSLSAILSTHSLCQPHFNWHLLWWWIAVSMREKESYFPLTNLTHSTWGVTVLFLSFPTLSLSLFPSCPRENGIKKVLKSREQLRNLYQILYGFSQRNLL